MEEACFTGFCFYPQLTAGYLLSAALKLLLVKDIKKDVVIAELYKRLGGG